MGRLTVTGTCAFALNVEGDSLPSTFRLFARGWNDTEHGRFLFDDEAAVSVMSAFKARGVDFPIDLEHQMLDAASVDPTARDARGWFQLAVISGELWAVNVRWTPDGAQRLSQKRQRYVSPAFQADPDSKRVSKIVNCAITAMPATHDTPALVAASTNGCPLDPSLIKKALDAIEAGDSAAALEILKGLIATAAGAEPEPADDAGGQDSGAEGTPSAPVEESAAPAPAAAAGDADKKDKQGAVAATARLLRLTSATSVVDAVAMVETFRASHLELETGRQKLAAERKIFESAERRRLAVDMVKSGMAPATVWADDKCVEIKAHLSAMPIEDFRAFASDVIKSSKSGARGAAPKTPATLNAKGAPVPLEGRDVVTSVGTVTLSADDIRNCEELKVSVATFAENKARMLAARAR